MSNTRILNISSFETNTFVFIICGIFPFITFLFYVYPFNKYLLSISHVSGTGPGPGESVVNKTDKNSSSHGAYIVTGERVVK